MNGKKSIDCPCTECKEWVDEIEKAYEVMSEAVEKFDLKPSATFFAVISIMTGFKRNGLIDDQDAFDVTGFFMKRFADTDYFVQTQNGIHREH